MAHSSTKSLDSCPASSVAMFFAFTKVTGGLQNTPKCPYRVMYVRQKKCDSRPPPRCKRNLSYLTLEDETSRLSRNVGN